MPLPLIIGAAALAATAYGAKKGYDGYQKHSEADEIVKSAQTRYDRNQSAFNEQEQETTFALDRLGTLEMEIGKSFSEFKSVADELLKKISQRSGKNMEVRIPKHELQKIESYTISAVGALSTAVGAGAAGAAAGFAVYGGVMALGVASTGTAISTLSGVAASNAALAAIGGGSLASGGLGIAGGTAILGAAVAAPVVAIAGWAYDSHGDAALSNAKKINREVDEAIRKFHKGIQLLSGAEEYARAIKRTLASIYRQFNRYFDSLKQINDFLQDIKDRGVDAETEIAKMGDEIVRTIENGYMLAAILTDIITTPIFKVKQIAGELVMKENGAPEMLTDEDGSMILNDEALDQALSKAKNEAKEYPIA